MREPLIKEGEWREFLKAKGDFEEPESLVGVGPAGKEISLPVEGFVWWLGHESGVPVPAQFTDEGVHVPDGGEGGAALAQVIAAYFGAEIQEGGGLKSQAQHGLSFVE